MAADHWNDVPPAPLQEAPASVMFIEAGALAHDAPALSLGLRRPWAQRSTPVSGVRWTGATDWSLVRGWLPAFRSEMRRREFTQLLVVPVLRWQLSEVPSPWFVEAGLGLSVLDRRYQLRQSRQSSRWNFEEVLAVGYRLGPGYELSVRLSHFSNAGLRRPNPGGERLMLRWTVPL